MHKLKKDGTSEQVSINANDGDAWLPKFKLGAGKSQSYTFDVVWDELSPKDWSITAWGQDGEVSVTYTADHYGDNP